MGSSNWPGDERAQVVLLETCSIYDQTSGEHIDSAEAEAESNDGGVQSKSPAVKEEVSEDTVTSVPTDPVGPDPLFEGWNEAADQSTCQFYHYNSETGETSWDRPLAKDSNPATKTGPSDDAVTVEWARSVNTLEDELVEPEDTETCGCYTRTYQEGCFA